MLELNDTLIQLMLRIDDDELRNFSSLNQQVYELYNDEFFWSLKVEYTFSELIKEKYNSETWREFYFTLKENFSNMNNLEFSQLIINMEINKLENTNFNQTEMFFYNFETGDTVNLIVENVEIVEFEPIKK